MLSPLGYSESLHLQNFINKINFEYLSEYHSQNINNYN